MAMMFKEDPDFAVHNKRANDTAARELKTVLEQIESAQAANLLLDELFGAVKADASRDETDICNPEQRLYTVAKSKGYNVRALRALVRERKRDADELRQERDSLALYKQLLGM